MKKVGVSKEEKQLSYYKYYERELAQIPQAKLEILKKSSILPAIDFKDRNLFLKGEDKDYCQIGYGVMENGTGFVCNETYMPHVTVEMLDWWFPWHSVGSDLRYKIWDNEDHYFARANKVDYVCNPDISVKEKTWGVSHHILEDTGRGPEYIQLNFKRPRDMGYDETIIGSEQCASLVCAIGEGQSPAAMTHKWYPYKEGVMLCSRFWMGYGLVNGEYVKVIPEGIQLPIEAPMSLFAHNIKEFSHLATILPEVYAENKDNF